MTIATSPAAALMNPELLCDGSHGTVGDPRNWSHFWLGMRCRKLAVERCVELDVDIDRPSMRSRLVILRSCFTREWADAKLDWTRFGNARHHRSCER